MSERPIAGVGVVAINDGKLLMVQRLGSAGAGQWAVPGGKVRYGERMTEAAAREALEETGLMVEVGEAIWVGEAIGPGAPPAWHYTLVDFTATVIGGDLHAGGDAGEVRWVPISELTQLDLVPSMYELIDVLGRSGSMP